jgi:hypothetical protein
MRGHAVYSLTNMPTTSVGMAPKTLLFCEMRSSRQPRAYSQRRTPPVSALVANAVYLPSAPVL